MLWVILNFVKESLVCSAGMWSRSRCLGLETVSRPIEGLVSVSSRVCRQTSRSRELRSRSWSRSRQFRSRAQVPANHIFLVWKFKLHHIETLFFNENNHRTTPLKWFAGFFIA